MPWLDDDTDGSDPVMPDTFDARAFLRDFGAPGKDEEREANEWAAQFERPMSDEELDAQYDAYQARHCADDPFDMEC